MNDANPKVEYLYKEYCRLSELAHDYAKSSFQDFIHLGSVGATLAWEPLAKAISDGVPDRALLLIGFTGIIFILAIFATRDLIKQSAIKFHLEQARFFEEVLRNELEIHGAGPFQLSSQWDKWEMTYNRPIFNRFFLLSMVFLLGLPTVVLLKPQGYTSFCISWSYHVIIFWLASAVAIAIYLNAAIKLKK